MNRRVWVVSELYYPEDGATGHLLTQIAEGLSQTHSVSVLCGQPYYSRSRPPSPTRETWRGVQITRVLSTKFPKDRLAGRIMNSLTVSASLFAHLVTKLQPSDQVLLVTNPPLLPFLALIATWVRRAGSVLIIHDIYPDVLVPTGFLTPNSFIYRIMNVATRFLYRRVDRIVTIGRDMADRVAAKDSRLLAKTTTIPNWADLDEIHPAEETRARVRGQLELEDKFVVQYSGNMGLTHELKAIAQAARIVEDKLGDRVHWMMCGQGGGRRELEKAKTELGLRHMTIRDPVSRDLVNESLNAADVAIISFKSGMAGVSVPSRMYNMLAAGLPIIGMCDPESELARVIEEDQVGWTVPPGNPAALADKVIDLVARQSEAPGPRIGQRCRRVAEAKYSRQLAIERYAAVLDADASGHVRPIEKCLDGS